MDSFSFYSKIQLPNIIDDDFVNSVDEQLRKEINNQIKNMGKKKELTALEELEDMGFEIVDYSTEEEPDGIKKIGIYIAFYDDGGWAIDSMDLSGINATLGSGNDLRKITPILKECRETFLKALRERSKSCIK